MLVYAGPYAVEVSILAGTIAGLPLRYFLEKRYVFGFQSEGASHDGRLFFVYSTLGVLTTGLFWSIEYLFHRLFDSDFMRYLGGAIGLTLGFLVKYRLDKRFVFLKLTDPAR